MGLVGWTDFWGYLKPPDHKRPTSICISGSNEPSKPAPGRHPSHSVVGVAFWSGGQGIKRRTFFRNPKSFSGWKNLGHFTSPEHETTFHQDPNVYPKIMKVILVLLNVAKECWASTKFQHHWGKPSISGSMGGCVFLFDKVYKLKSFILRGNPLPKQKYHM